MRYVSHERCPGSSLSLTVQYGMLSKKSICVTSITTGEVFCACMNLNCLALGLMEGLTSSVARSESITNFTKASIANLRFQPCRKRGAQNQVINVAEILLGRVKGDNHVEDVAFVAVSPLHILFSRCE